MDEFYTLKGYQANEPAELTPAMEDYLEMLRRLGGDGSPVRLGELAGALHVRPSSASKMVQLLCGAGYALMEKYGHISLTDKGRAAGDYLLYRHKVLHEFLCLLNGPEGQLEQAEKIEHFLDRATVDNLARLVERLGKE